MDSLVGKLQHAPAVVKPGWTFLLQLFELLPGTKRVHHHIPFHGEARSDITWWDTFMEAWNEVSIISTLGGEEVTHDLWNDAAGSSGCGAKYGGQWFQH